MENRALVSIIMPLYNAQAYVAEAIETVLAQSYRNWELIVVDDCSTDESVEIVERFDDPRIKIYRQRVNCGAAKARNRAISEAKGSIIAYLDSDDVWLPNKIERQIAFMREYGADVCFTSYETIREDGSHYNYVHVPYKLDYQGFLKNTITCSHTMMINVCTVPKELIYAPIDEEFDYPEDLVTWLQILKSGFVAFGCDEVLAKNRKRSGSRSANRLSAVGRTWNAYRRIENLSTLRSAYCLFWQVFHAVKKRLRWPN